MVFLEFEKPLNCSTNNLTRSKKLAKGRHWCFRQDQGVGKKIQNTQRNLFQSLRLAKGSVVETPGKTLHLLFYIDQIFTRFTELHGDRYFADDKAIVGGLAKLGGQTVMVMGHQKASIPKCANTATLVWPIRKDTAKALRLMKMAERFNIPVVLPHRYTRNIPALKQKERGQAEAIARNLFEMAQLRVPSFVTSLVKGASGGALGIGLGDKGIYVGKYMVYRYFTRIMFIHPLEELGLQRNGSRNWNLPLSTCLNLVWSTKSSKNPLEVLIPTRKNGQDPQDSHQKRIANTAGNAGWRQDHRPH